MGTAKYGAYREAIEELLRKGTSPVLIEKMGEYHGKVPLSAIRFWKFSLDHPEHRKKASKAIATNRPPLARSSEVLEALDRLVDAIRKELKERL